MTTDVEPLRISAEALGIPVDPGNRASYLIGHFQKVAAILSYVNEIRDDKIRASVDKHFRRIVEVAGKPRLPSAAMHEHMHWRVRRFGGEDVHSLDCGRAISEALRSAEPLAHEFAVSGATLQHLFSVRPLSGVVVGVFDFLLVNVEPYQRPFCARSRWLCQSQVAGRHRRQRDSARGQMQKLTAGKSHGVSSKNIDSD